MHGLWAKSGESLKDRWGWEGPEPDLMGVHYVPNGSQLALDAGAKPQLQTRGAIEIC